MNAVLDDLGCLMNTNLNFSLTDVRSSQKVGATRYVTP